MVTRQSIRIATLAIAATVFGNSGLFAQQTAHMQKKNFRIPYHIDPMVAAQLKPREVRLHVSSDRGRTWELSRTAEPSITHFRFTAPKDGEYWFDVRTVDSDNKIHPPDEGYSPSLKVVIDSAPPKITLNLTQVDATRAAVQWSVEDSGLLLETLAFEYMEPATVHWQHMGMVGAASGGTMWQFKRSGIAKVRCRAKDKAGNEGTAEKTIDLSVVQLPPTINVIQTASRAGGNSREQLGMNPLGVTTGTPSLGSPQLGHPQLGNPQLRTASPPQPRNSVDAVYGNAPSTQLPYATTAEPQLVMGHSDPAQPHSQPEVQPVPTSDRREDVQTPPVKKRRVVSSNSFLVNYEMNGLGPSGLSRVEFFITENDGLKWWKYGDDRDKQSPFMIQVPHDGVFGFAIRASSGAGLAGDAPGPGDKPEVIVEVDTTRPELQLKPFDPNSAPGKRALKIAWSAYDANLSNLPVGLYFARQKSGPWESISGWIANSGEYTWNVGPDVPTNVYLRIAARDTAGNLTQLDTKNPIVVDTARPSARIVDVQLPGQN